MEMRLRAPVSRGYFFLLGALRREISFRKKYPLESRVRKDKIISRKKTQVVCILATG